MRILVINRVDDPACANAMRLIPGAEVRTESEDNHDACEKAFTEFTPHIIVVSDPSDPEEIERMDREPSGLIIWHPSSILMSKPLYSFFASVKDYGCGYNFFHGITDFNNLAVRVVENCVPEVSIFITDSDKFWQEHLKKDFSEIPGVAVSLNDGSLYVGDAIRNLAPDIVVMNWLDALPPNFIRGYAKDPIGLKIAVFSGINERDIIAKAPQVDFVLCKSSPVRALTLMVEYWAELIQIDKRRELREGLLRNQRQSSQSS